MQGIDPATPDSGILKSLEREEQRSSNYYKYAGYNSEEPAVSEEVFESVTGHGNVGNESGAQRGSDGKSGNNGNADSERKRAYTGSLAKRNGYRKYYTYAGGVGDSEQI